MLRHSAVERYDGTSSDDDKRLYIVRSPHHKFSLDNEAHSQVPPIPPIAARPHPLLDGRTWTRLHCTTLSWLLAAVCLLLCVVLLVQLAASPTSLSTSRPLSAFFSASPSAPSVPYSTTLSNFLSSLPPTLNYQQPNHTCILFSHDPAYPPCPLPPNPPPLPPTTHITAAFTVCGSDVQQYAITHLKSWMLQQPPNTTYAFYILTDDVKAQSQHFNNVISHWPRQPTLHWLDILSLPPLYQRYLNEFKRCATARVYLPLLLPPTVHRIAYMDVDTLLLADPRRLWQHFHLFQPNRTLLAFAWETSYPDVSTNWYLKQPTDFPFVRPWGLNSGVMLMDVAAVRGWVGSGSGRVSGRNYSEVMMDVWDRYGGLLKLGDQDWYNVMLELVRRESGGMDELFVVLSESVNWRVGSGAVGGVEWVGGGGGAGAGGGVGGWYDGGVVVVHGMTDGLS